MQRTAQDWLVFAHLTAHDAGAVGITMALQLGPQLFLAPVAGLLADRFYRKRLLVLTQSAMALLSAGRASWWSRAQPNSGTSTLLPSCSGWSPPWTHRPPRTPLCGAG
jgi:MFS family permease